MNYIKDPRTIFNRLHGIYGIIGEAIKAARVSLNCSKKELTKRLQDQFHWDINARRMNAIENGYVEIEFDHFREIAETLGCSTKQILKVAVILEDNRKKTPEELAKNLQREYEYDLFKAEQKKQQSSEE